MSNQSSIPSLTKYKTKDLNQAAYIWSQPGVSLETMEARVNSKVKGVVYFSFILPFSDKELRVLLMDYTNGKALVDPKLFSSKQSDLREWIHSTLASRTSNTLSKE